MVTHIHDTLLKSLYSPSPLFPPPPRNAKNMTISIIMTRVSKLFSQVSTINSQSVKKRSAKLATKLRQDMLPLVKSMQKQHPKARLLVLRDFWGEKKKVRAATSLFTTETWKTTQQQRTATPQGSTSPGKEVPAEPFGESKARSTHTHWHVHWDYSTCQWTGCGPLQGQAQKLQYT